MTSKESVAAQNRFVYYPDHLVCMPGPGRSLIDNLSTVLSESTFKGLWSGVLSGIFRSSIHDAYDESVGSFVSRHFGSSIADNLVSAVFHGIYAGDIYQLSARSILPKPYKIGQTVPSFVLGSIGELMRQDPLVLSSDHILMENLNLNAVGSELFERIRKSSVFTFKKGIGQLAESLENALDKNPLVTVLKSTPIEAIKMISDGQKSKVSS